MSVTFIEIDNWVIKLDEISGWKVIHETKDSCTTHILIRGASFVRIPGDVSLKLKKALNWGV